MTESPNAVMTSYSPCSGGASFALASLCASKAPLPAGVGFANQERSDIQWQRNRVRVRWGCAAMPCSVEGYPGSSIGSGID